MACKQISHRSATCVCVGLGLIEISSKNRTQKNVPFCLRVLSLLLSFIFFFNRRHSCKPYAYDEISNTILSKGYTDFKEFNTFSINRTDCARVFKLFCMTKKKKKKKHSETPLIKIKQVFHTLFSIMFVFHFVSFHAGHTK